MHFICNPLLQYIRRSPACNYARIAIRLRSDVVISGTLPRHGKGVAVGQYATVERVFTEHDVDTYARLVGDSNPLHTSWTRQELEQQSTELPSHPLVQWTEDNKSKVLVHGMLVASLFTCIFGTHIPGAVYMKQTLAFRRPVFANEPVTGRVAITAVRDFRKGGLIVTCDTRVYKDTETECVRGSADVWLIHGTKGTVSE
jgi:acyl dehydratase